MYEVCVAFLQQKLSVRDSNGCVNLALKASSPARAQDTPNNRANSTPGSGARMNASPTRKACT